MTTGYTRSAYDRRVLMNKLDRECNEFVEKEFGIKKTIRFVENSRLSSSLGRFVEYRYQPILNRLEVSTKLLSYYTEDLVLNVMKHECIHYALYTLGRPYGDSSREFVATCHRYGVYTTRVISPARYYVYKCPCGCTIRVRKKLNQNHHYSCRVHHKLVNFVGTELPDENYILKEEESN